ncbi:hypothetical protein AURDEDRAFT_154060 [Auricularia subglabra TFB-10046 SS5]|nr:hypothetical protein AURDEDRAFT_154060 [Auricularia subglabra TFB-10046 SS5]
MDKDLKIQELEEALVLLVEHQHSAWFQEVTDEFRNETALLKLLRCEKRAQHLEAKLRETSDDLRRCRVENSKLQDTNSALFESVSMLLQNEKELLAEHTRLRTREEDLGQEISAKNEAIHGLEIKCQENVDLGNRLIEMEEKLSSAEADSAQSQRNVRHYERLNKECRAEVEGLWTQCTALEGETAVRNVPHLRLGLLRRQTFSLASDRARGVARVLELETLLDRQAAQIDTPLIG